MAWLAVDVGAGPGVADVGVHFLKEVFTAVASFFADAAGELERQVCSVT